jgi:DNA-binding LytR/AlgR family response regulator
MLFAMVTLPHGRCWPEQTFHASRRGDSLRLFDPREVARFTARHGYTAFTADGQEYLLDESMTKLERRLMPLGFVRVHRRELINASRVTGLSRRGEETIAELDTGERVGVSRRQVAILRERLGLT